MARLATGAAVVALTLVAVAFAIGNRASGSRNDAQSARLRSSPLRYSTASAGRVQPQPAPDSCHARGSGLYSLPDPRCTPGSLDPAVSQSDIRRTICREGYTDQIRPPESVTEPEKRASLAAYGDRRPIWDYEYDHLVPLELGGARNDPHNLWPEPGASPNRKDRLEDRLNGLVCSGRIGLAAAQIEIARDWVSAYRSLVGST